MTKQGRHVFISYAHRDEAAAGVFQRWLEAADIATWRDPAMHSGPVHAQIVEHIERCAVFLVLVSRSSVSSEWVSNELALALDRRRPVVPVVIGPLNPKELKDIWALLFVRVQFFDLRLGQDRIIHEVCRLLGIAPAAAPPLMQEGWAQGGDAPVGTRLVIGVVVLVMVLAFAIWLAGTCQP